MKTSHRAATAAAVIAMCILTSTPCFAKRKTSSGSSGSSNTQTTEETFPKMPSGWLSAFPTIVQTGTKPTISWGINYPSIVEDYITIIDPGTIEADEEVDCEIRILGAGVTVGNNSGFSFVPTEALVGYDGGSYSRIFYGTNDEVNPNQVVYTKTVAKNKKLRFGGRYYYNRSWGTFFNSDSSGQNVRALVNGSTPPSNVPEYNAPSLESFIKPYLNASGKVNIGPMDVIIFMELTHTNTSDSGYDLQDMVLLVTFKSKAKTNNGHGNNIDGIDSSNPGNAPFINLDTDPNVDDEGGGGGAAPSN